MGGRPQNSSIVLITYNPQFSNPAGCSQGTELWIPMVALVGFKAYKA